MSYLEYLCNLSITFLINYFLIILIVFYYYKVSLDTFNGKSSESTIPLIKLK